MNCHDVQPFLDRLAAPSGAAPFSNDVGIREHLATCVHCQLALQSILRWDEQLSRAMKDVAVPTGLSQRLTVALQQSSFEGSKTNSMVSRPVRRRTWSRTYATLMAIVVVGVAIWLTRLFVLSPTLSPANVALLLQQPIQDLPFEKDASGQLPKDWSSVQKRVVMGDWKRVTLDGFSTGIPVMPFEMSSPRSPHVDGLLFVIPKSQWALLPATSTSRSTVQYAPPHVWVAWSERDFVYILALNGPVPLMEQLQRQLDGNDSVL